MCDPIILRLDRHIMYRIRADHACFGMSVLYSLRTICGLRAACETRTLSPPMNKRLVCSSNYKNVVSLRRTVQGGENIPLWWNISGAVYALARQEGVGNKLHFYLFRLVQVLTSNLKTSNKQFSFDTDRVRSQVLVEDVDAVVGERTTNDTSRGGVRGVCVWIQPTDASSEPYGFMNLTRLDQSLADSCR